MKGGVMQPVTEAVGGVKANLSARKKSRRVRSVEGTAGMYTKEKAGGVGGASGSGRLIREDQLRQTSTDAQTRGKEDNQGARHKQIMTNL